MPKFLSNINLETANDVQFKTTAGAAAGKIEQNGNDLVLSNAVGDVLIGDGNADVYIGDGTNNVDILFEQSGSIKAEDGSSGVTLTLGSSDTTLVFGGQTNLADVVSAMSATGVNTVDIGTSVKPFKNIYAAHHVGGSSINYATSRGWVEDAVPLSSTQGGFYGGNFTRNGDADENAVVRGQDPFNNKALLWKCILHDTDDDADGGWNKNITIPANNNIGYLSYVYFMADFTPDSNTAGSRDGTVYLGCGQTAGQTINVSDDSSNTNPYFTSSSLFTINNGGPVVANRWYLIIGVIQPYNDSTTGSDTISGVYDVETGERVAGGGEFKMGNNTTSQVHRAYMYYDESGDAGENVYFWNPGFHAIDGSEPKIQDLVKRQVYLDDGIKAAFGTGNDLQIYHDATDSTILNATGDFKLTCTGDDVVIQAADDVDILVQGGEVSAKFGGNGAVDLYHNNVKKFSTASGGVEVVGEVQGDTLNIDGNADISGTLTVGVDDTGHDVKFFGATSGSYMLWDESADILEFVNSKINITGNNGSQLSVTAGNAAWDASINLDTSGANGQWQIKAEGSDETFRIVNIDQGGTAPLTIHPTTKAATFAGKVTGTELEGTSLDINGNADISGNLTGVDSITASATVQAEHLYSTDDLVVDDDASVGGDLTVSGSTFGLYHETTEDGYYHDSYTGSKNLSLFLKNQRADIIRYQAVDNFEYWNGSAWVADASQEANVKKLLDGRQDTMWAVPSTYYKFRFTTNQSTGYPTRANIGIQTSWSGSTWPGCQMLVEHYESSSWVLHATMEFGGQAGGSATALNSNDNSIDNWGLMFKADSALHDGQGSSADTTRITVDFHGWSPSDASHTTVPLQNIFITSNYAGTENTDYTNLFSHARNLTIPAGITLDGNTINGIDDSSEFTDDDAHVMTSAAINDRFAQINANTTGSSGSCTGNAATATALTSGNKSIAGSLTVTSASDGILNLRQSDAGSTAGTKEAGWNYIQFQDGQGDRQAYFGIDNSGNLTFNPEVSGGIVKTNTGLYVGGNVTLSGTVDGIDIATRDAILTSTTTTASAALPKAGGTMSGAIAMGGQNITGAGTITGTTLTGTSLDINGNADISGNLTGLDNVTSTNFIIGGHTIDDVDVAGEFVDSANHLITSAAANDRFAQINANTTGSSGSCTGNAATATTLATARAINGVDFDGSAAITVTAAGSTLSDTVTVAKGGTGLTTVATNTILTGNGTNALTAEANFQFVSNRLTIGDNTQDIQPYIRMFNDENTLEFGVANGANDFVGGSADGDIVLNSFGDHNVIIGQSDVAAFTVDTNGDSNFNRRFTVTGDTDGTYEGDVVYFGGTTSMTVGKIYHYKSDGTWEPADADAASTSDGLLGVALGAASDTNGMLLRGMVTLDHDPGAVGDVLYLSTTHGSATSTAPSGNNDIVRVIGYCLHASNGQIWFNPDSTFVEVTA